MEEIKKDIFCAKCQEVTSHRGEVDSNGEYIFYCTNTVEDVECDRFLKLPATMTKTEFNERLTVHEESNKGQVSIEAQEKMLAEMVKEDEEQTEEE